MRFKEFFTEAPVPLIVAANPAQPTPAGYKRWNVEGKVVFALANMTGPQISDALVANPALLGQQVAPQQPAPQQPAPQQPAPAQSGMMAPQGLYKTPDSPAGFVLVRTPTGELIHVEKRFSDGQGRLNAEGLKRLKSTHSNFALQAVNKIPPELQQNITQAKTAADSYLGRPLAEEEWDILLRLTNAESSSDPKEQAWIMGSVLNSVRTKKQSIYSAMTVKNRYQSATGNKKDPTASPNFTNPPPKGRLKSIASAATTLLPSVPKDIVHFTAANEKLYSKEQGTSADWYIKLLKLLQDTKKKKNPPGIYAVQIGKTILSTDFPQDYGQRKPS
jgi:hypothetical protein